MKLVIGLLLGVSISWNVMLLWRFGADLSSQRRKAVEDYAISNIIKDVQIAEMIRRDKPEIALRYLEGSLISAGLIADDLLYNHPGLEYHLARLKRYYSEFPVEREVPLELFQILSDLPSSPLDTSSKAPYWSQLPE